MRECHLVTASPRPHASKVVKRSNPSQRLPWISLLLLLLSYSTFSYYLFNETLIWWTAWAIVIGTALTQALLLTTFFRGIREFVRTWLESDIGYFSLVLISAFSLAVILVWFHVFEYVLLVLMVELLARLDLQSAGYNQWVDLVTLTVFSLLGVALGWWAHSGSLPLVSYLVSYLFGYLHSAVHLVIMV